eukprot:TRINITY_DN2619_c1_g1_i1.p1 TRINITY_DN2619_c1_g1~~TRINITY_DN2619_c1_g1_i1.p1  ORF type:complete len:226 (+),score=45.15 TRINITY_DN2619_c1_g1_i1:582-1259(+)
MDAEPLLLESIGYVGDEFRFLERHLERLSTSCLTLGYCNDKVRMIPDALRKYVSVNKVVEDGHLCMVRVTVSKDGVFEVGHRLLEWPVPLYSLPKEDKTEEYPRRSISVNTEPIDTHGVYMVNKTTMRKPYDAVRSAAPPGTFDTLIVNSDGHLTEGCFTNVAVLANGAWTTPHISCGLLPGTLRADFLSSGDLQEGLITAEDLRTADMIVCFNSVRGVVVCNVA